MTCVEIWVILCSDEGSWRNYSAFRSSPEVSIAVSLSPGPPTFGEWGSTNMYLLTFVCVSK